MLGRKSSHNLKWYFTLKYRLYENHIFIYILEQLDEKLNLKRTTRSNLYHVADQLQMDYLTKESASNMKE